MIKPTRIAAGHYEYKGFTIERLPCGEWYTGPTGEFAQDVTSTLAEAVAIVDDVTALDDNNNALSTETRTALTTELLTVGRAIRKGLKGGFNVDGLAAEADLLIDALKTKENTDVIEYDTTSGNANR